MKPLYTLGIRRRSVIAALPAGLACAAGPSFAQTFPSRPIKLIVAFAPGSGADAAARYYAEKLGHITKQSVVVEHHPGGNGLIAVGQLMRAAPDGHTVLIAGASHFTTNVVLYKQLPYDPINDFIPLGLVVSGAVVMAVPASSPYQTVKDLVDKAKASPLALNSGSGSASYQLSLASFYKMAGVQLRNVPFKGTTEVTAALAGGVVDVGLVSPVSAIPLVKAGKVRIIATGSERRIPELPDVPTFIEQGYPGFTSVTWGGAALAAKTPQPIVNQLRDWFAQINGLEDTRAFFRRVAAEPGAGGWQAMRGLIVSEIDRWRVVAAEAGITPE